MDPVFDPERYMPLIELQYLLSKTGKRRDLRAVREWLIDRGVRVIRLTRRYHVVERAAVDAALRGEQHESQTDPDFDPANWMPLAELASLLCSGRKRRDHRLTVKWCARAGVPVWRVNPRVALVPRAAVKEAMARQTSVPTPMRRRASSDKRPPWVLSRAQQASQAKAAKASSEYHAAIREGRTPPAKAKPLTGDAKVQRKRQLTEWGREARKAERRGNPIPAVPPVEREQSKPAPRTRETVSLDRPAPQPLHAQPMRRAQVI